MVASSTCNIEKLASIRFLVLGDQIFDLAGFFFVILEVVNLVVVSREVSIELQEVRSGRTVLIVFHLPKLLVER